MGLKEGGEEGVVGWDGELWSELVDGVRRGGGWREMVEGVVGVSGEGEVMKRSGVRVVVGRLEGECGVESSMIREAGTQ